MELHKDCVFDRGLLEFEFKTYRNFIIINCYALDYRWTPGAQDEIFIRDRPRSVENNNYNLCLISESNDQIHQSITNILIHYNYNINTSVTKREWSIRVLSKIYQTV